MNFDQRSKRINTEVGLIIDSPELAQQTAIRFEAMAQPENSYALALRPGSAGGSPRLVWQTREDGKAVGIRARARAQRLAKTQSQTLGAVSARPGTMNGRSLAVLGLVLALALLPVARAAPLATAQTEINYLLGFIESSGCEFYRNGSWYDSKQAQAHLRHKYQMLAAGDQINTAEDFIEKAATKSSLSGRAYHVRCGGEVVTSSQWLRDVLARYRAHVA